MIKKKTSSSVFSCSKVGLLFPANKSLNINNNNYDNNRLYRLLIDDDGLLLCMVVCVCV